MENDNKLISANELEKYKFNDATDMTILISRCNGKTALNDMIYNAYKVGWNECIDAIRNNEPTANNNKITRCQDCKYQVKEWREDKRMKEKGYWVYGCRNFGEIFGYWGWGGYDNQYCSDAEPKDTGGEND